MRHVVALIMYIGLAVVVSAVGLILGLFIGRVLREQGIWVIEFRPHDIVL